MEQFAVGDLVELLSGSPVMTVTGLNPNGAGSVKTQWFAGKKLEWGSFPSAALKKAVAEEE